MTAAYIYRLQKYTEQRHVSTAIWRRVANIELSDNSGTSLNSIKPVYRWSNWINSAARKCLKCLTIPIYIYICGRVRSLYTSGRSQKHSPLPSVPRRLSYCSMQHVDAHLPPSPHPRGISRNLKFGGGYRQILGGCKHARSANLHWKTF